MIKNMKIVLNQFKEEIEEAIKKQNKSFSGYYQK